MTIPLARTEQVATLATLTARGMTRHAIRVAIARGELTRLRNGCFARPDAPIPIQRAMRLGGRLTCLSQLERLGVWVYPDLRLHISVAPNAARLRCPDDRHRQWDPREHPDIRLHWEQPPPASGSTTEPLDTTVAHLITCMDGEAAIASIDSALNKGVLTRARLRRILGLVPGMHGWLADWVDGRAQSGTESLARVRLRRLGLRVRIQAAIAGVGNVDLLVGDRLVIEIDSRTHHLGENYEKDRKRDLELVRQGFIVIRVSYRRVLDDWASVESAVLEMTRRGDHLRSGIHRRLGLAMTLD